ncbi:hypothetical protein [Herbaspirillum huttiense]|uniref:hypothetical protein n=1 Tax=Herbaspirillum huttiense TaxID=863372 RepID=UPI001416F7CA|nr:hypothetical protein [Herbaspirillum huttiense]
MKEVVILPFQDSLSAGNGTLEQEGMLSAEGKRRDGRAGLRRKKNSEISSGKNK